MFSPKFIHIIPNPGSHHGFPPPLSISFDRACNISESESGERAIKIGEITGKNRFSQRVEDRIVDLNTWFKREGDGSYSVAGAYAQFEEAFQIIIDYETTFSDFYAHKQNFITMRQDFLHAGKCQSVSRDWHHDGLPDLWHLSDHIYIVSDREGTLIQSAPIPDALSRLRALGEMPKPNPDLFIRAEPYSIYLMTSSCFHKSPIMQKPGLRTFLRVTYDSPADEILKALPPEKRLKLGFR